jgi:DNA-binding HxlR family transcriptional regulator
MLPRTYEGQNCSIAKSLEVLGERWTLLVIREAFLGTRRFEGFMERLDIARNVLTARLSRLVEEDVLERVPYQERPPRYEYRLTEKGRDLWPVIVALLQFGDRYYAPDGPPLRLRHRDCGGSLDDRRACTRCGALLEPRDVIAEAPARASGPARRGRPARPRARAPRRP